MQSQLITILTVVLLSLTSASIGGILRARLPLLARTTMPTSLRAVTLLCFLLYPHCASAQESNDLLALPPLSAEYALEGEAAAETETALWTPAFLSGSSSAVTNSLRQGRVYSAVDFAMLSASDEALRFDGDSVLTPRFQLGWESESGFGVRGSYWTLNENVRDSKVSTEISLTDSGFDPLFIDSIHVDRWHNLVAGPDGYVIGSLAPSDSNMSFLGQESDSVDIDVYQRVNAGQTRLLLGLGLRTVRNSRQFEHLFGELTIGETIWHAGDVSNESIAGTGVTFVSEFNHPLFSRDTTELGFVLGGRTSYIPAEFEVKSEFINHSFDDELWINEGNVGLELLSRRRHLTLRLRGQFETQYWNSSVTDNQAFTGTSLCFGVDW